VTHHMKTPDQTTAEVCPRHLSGELLTDSTRLKWPGFFARRYRFARLVDGLLVPATAEPLITCQLNGSAEFQEREIGDAWCLDGFGAETSSLRAQDPLRAAFRPELRATRNVSLLGRFV
jgi:hypothetical protein